MLDPLGMLVITFIVMSVISVIGVALLYASKNEKLQKALLFLLAVFGMVIAYCNVLSTPFYMTGSIVLAWVLGGLGAIGILVQLCLKHEKKLLIAKLLVTASVVLGMIDCFLI